MVLCSAFNQDPLFVYTMVSDRQTLPSCRGLALYYQEPTKVHSRFSCQCGRAKATSTVPGLLIHSPPVLPKAQKPLPLPHSSLPSTLALGSSLQAAWAPVCQGGFSGLLQGKQAWRRWVGAHTVGFLLSVHTLLIFSAYLGGRSFHLI